MKPPKKPGQKKARLKNRNAAILIWLPRLTNLVP